MSDIASVLRGLDLHQIAAAVRARKVTSFEVVSFFLDRIDKYDARLGAFVHVSPDDALEAAAAVDKAVQEGNDPGTLAGVPFATKDNMDVAGMPTLHGSWYSGDALPAKLDAPVVSRLRAAGAIPLGKTNTPEFGMHSATYNERFGPTHNPWNLSRTPGGSSGGSAAAVAAGLVPFAVGTDGGGSIRTPAAFCGLVGLKTTHALVPRPSGRSSLSCVGFLTTSVIDTAVLLDVCCGLHLADRMSLPAPSRPFVEQMKTAHIISTRAAWSENLGFAPVEKEATEMARAAFERLATCAQLDVQDIKVTLPNIYEDWILDSMNFLAEELNQEGIEPGKLDQRTRDLIARFAHSDSAIHVRTQANFERLEAKLATLFDQVALLATPATACQAFGAQDEVPDQIEGADAAMTGAEPLSMFANVAGVPAISIPAGFATSGLPLGLQLAAPRFGDGLLLGLARMHEQANPWPRLAPAYAF